MCDFVVYFIGLWGKELQKGGHYFTAKCFGLFTCLAPCGSFVLEFRIHLVDSPSVTLCGKVGACISLCLARSCTFYFTFRLTGKYTKIVAIALPVSFSIRHVVWI